MRETKADKLLAWVRERGRVSAIGVREWGLDNGYIRADRTMRDFAELGQNVRRMTDYEIDAAGLRKPNAKRIAWWEVI